MTDPDRGERDATLVAIPEPPAGGAEHFGELPWQQLRKYAQLLMQEGELRGLVGPRELTRLWDRHILNSTAVSGFLPTAGKVADIGSGAGFPGVVLAILHPELEFWLVEAMERRTDWLELCQQELQLSNVRVVRARAEDLVGETTFTAVTARAVAALKKLIPLTLPLIESGGSLLAMKGARAEQEISEAVTQLRKFKVDWADVYDVPIWGAESTRIVELRKL
ncbi:MAG: 16S rRNA (guanine(527)-N(7))-methyltransferase RsmG [Trueperella sp.]|nr:16S rRNA (guanine(527)-N(7))-methyltransferase RsmG [Trueperella sp.]